MPKVTLRFECLAIASDIQDSSEGEIYPCAVVYVCTYALPWPFADTCAHALIHVNVVRTRCQEMEWTVLANVPESTVKTYGLVCVCVCVCVRACVLGCT